MRYRGRRDKERAIREREGQETLGESRGGKKVRGNRREATNVNRNADVRSEEKGTVDVGG